jgi:hypothetical protein
MNLNLVSAILINLWVAGWIAAGLRAARQARAQPRASRPAGTAGAPGRGGG